MREPRQWLNVLNIVLVVQGFEKLVIVTDPLDTEMSKVEKERMNAKSQGNFGDDSIMETLS